MVHCLGCFYSHKRSQSPWKSPLPLDVLPVPFQPLHFLLKNLRVSVSCHSWNILQHPYILDLHSVRRVNAISTSLHSSSVDSVQEVSQVDLDGLQSALEHLSTCCLRSNRLFLVRLPRTAPLVAILSPSACIYHCNCDPYIIDIQSTLGRERKIARKQLSMSSVIPSISTSTIENLFDQRA